VASLLELHFESVELRRLFGELKAAGDGLHIELRRGIKEAGDDAKKAVQGAAAWSTRIPGATRVSTSFSASSAGARIVVNARAAPNARPINNNGRGGTFRHPVFGTKTWVSQPARPFMAAADAPGVQQAMRSVMDRVAHQAGFK